MTELDILKRNLFTRGDATVTTDFKVCLGRDSEVTMDEVCAEINRVLSQDRMSPLDRVASIDSDIKRVNVRGYLATL